jgi:hypothetical protein
VSTYLGRDIVTTDAEPIVKSHIGSATHDAPSEIKHIPTLYWHTWFA